MASSTAPYQSQSTASAILQPANRRGANVYSGFAEGANALAKGVTDIAQTAMTSMDSDARAWSLQAASTSDLKSSELFTLKSQNAKEGGAGFKDDVLKDWNDYVSKTLQAAPNNASKEYLTAHLASTTERLTLQATDFQDKERLNWRTDQIGKALNADAKNISMLSDPHDIDGAVAESLGKINGYYASEPMTPDMRRKLTDKAREDITNAGALRQIQLDPKGYLTRNASARNPEVLKADPNAPVGIRNNNPGNLRTTQFTGNIGQDKNGYAIFDTPEAGIRATAKNLIAQQDKHGLYTLNEIIEKWAPASDNNNPQAYAATVAKAVGVKPDERINLKDPETLQRTMAAMFRVENGDQPYSGEQIAAGATAALEGKPVKALQTQGLEDGTRVKTSSQTFSLGTWEQQQKWTALAETENRRLITEHNQQVTNATAMLNSVKERMSAGLAIPDTDRAQVDAAITATADPKTTKLWMDLQATQQLTDRMQKLPPAALDTLINTQLEPLAKRDGATEREFLQLEVAKKIYAANTERAQNDPISLAASAGLDVMPLDFNKPETITARQANAASIAQTYGVTPKFFSAGETRQLSQQLGTMSTDGKLSFMQRLSANINDPEMYRTAMEQLRPDSPVTAMAGMFMNAAGNVTTAKHFFGANETVNAEQVAKNLIEGEALINPPATSKKDNGVTKGFPMPQDSGATGMRQAFNNTMGDAFRNSPILADQAYQAVRAYYAAESAHAGDYSGTLNTDVMDKAINAVIGKPFDKNGLSFIAPWGMDETTFNDIGKMRYDQLLAINKMNTPTFAWENAKLQTNGNGTYLIKNGNGYLLGDDGQPLLLDMRKAK